MPNFLRLVLLTFWAIDATVALAGGVSRDEFEGQEPSLRAVSADAVYKLEQHRRVAQGMHSGRGCEHLRISGSNGTYVYFGKPIEPARVIGELKASLWVKADRPGVQILARIVLPRSADPQTGAPITSLVRGGDYQHIGQWQQLAIDDFPKLVDRQVRVLRAKFGPQIDAREALVDLILINVYGGPGATNIWIDDLEISGIIGLSPDSAVELAAYDNAAAPNDRAGGARWPSGQGVPKAEMKGRALLVAERPFFPRAIDWNGEPLSRLQSLGFNCVRLPQAATATLAREAAALGLWLIAPPPDARELEARAAQGAQIAADFDAVLAWDLGSGFTKKELPAVKRWAELVKAADPRNRPLLCDPDSDLLNYTRLVDVLLATREPLGTTLTLDQYGAWVKQRSQLARGGTPVWVTIQTEISPRLIEQVAAASGQAAPDMLLEEHQIRNLIHVALASRARGLCFKSRSRLDGNDPASMQRAAVLELINLHLDLIDRWPAGGSFAPSASTNDSHLTGAVMATDRSRVLLPIFAPPHAQIVTGNPAAKDLSFLVPGVPEGYNASELSPTSFRPLAGKRISGGTRVVLTESERDSAVVFTQDPLVTAAISERIAKVRARATHLTRETALTDLANIGQVERQLAAVGRTIPVTEKARVTAETQLHESESIARSDVVKAYYLARKAQHALRDIERAHLNAALPNAEPDLTDPFLGHFATLPAHYRFQQQVGTLPRAANRLDQGGFEDLEAMRRAGWIYYQHQQPSITTSVDLAPASAHAGRAGLRLRATAADPNNKPSVIESAPLWINSPRVELAAHDIVVISGWVRVTEPVTASVDGLLVLDTLGGDAMAQRITTTKDWRQFTLYRVAPRPGPLVVTLALTGLGEVWLDDFSVEVKSRPTGPPAAAQPMAAGPARR